ARPGPRLAERGRRPPESRDRSRQDPGPRRLPPGPGPPDRRRLRDPRLRGGAGEAPGGAGPEVLAAQGRGRDAPLVRLRGLRRPLRLREGPTRNPRPAGPPGEVVADLGLGRVPESISDDRQGRPVPPSRPV